MFWYIYSRAFTKYLHGTWSLLNVLMIFGISENTVICTHTMYFFCYCYKYTPNLRLVLWSRVTYWHYLETVVWKHVFLIPPVWQNQLYDLKQLSVLQGIESVSIHLWSSGTHAQPVHFHYIGFLKIRQCRLNALWRCYFAALNQDEQFKNMPDGQTFQCSWISYSFFSVKNLEWIDLIKRLRRGEAPNWMSCTSTSTRK